MINNLFRATGIIIFLIILIMDDFPFYAKLKEQYVQLLLAIFIVMLSIFDYLSGLIYALTLMLIYFEIYKNIGLKKNTLKKEAVNNDKYNTSMNYSFIENFMNNEEKKTEKSKEILMDYISEKHLVDAQNNIFIENNSEINVSKTDFDIQGIKNNDTDYSIGGYDLNKKIIEMQTI